MNDVNVKSAMSDSSKATIAKYMAAALAAGSLGAGAGLLVSGSKRNKLKEDVNNLTKNRSTIVVDIKKDKFLEGLPTPSELAASRSEPEQINTSSEDVDALKKTLLRKNGRKVGFIPKAASPEPEAKEATVNVEKKADDGFWDSTQFGDLFPGGEITIPRKPLWAALGLAGSIFLANKIVDKVNESRAKQSKAEVEDARNRYLSLVQKSASDSSFTGAAGALLGGAFFIPAALSIMLTSKILKNREKNQEKNKELSDSYPEEPVILYKTSAAKDIRISPDVALCLMEAERTILEKCAASTLSDSEKDIIDEFFRQANTPQGMNSLGKAYLQVLKTGKMPSIDDLGFKLKPKSIVGYFTTDRTKVRNAILRDPRFLDMAADVATSDKNIGYTQRAIAHKLAKQYGHGSFVYNMLNAGVSNPYILKQVVRSQIPNMIRSGQV